MTPIQLSIALDRPNRVYLTGERITGTISVSVMEPVDCDELVVELGHRYSGKSGRGDGLEASVLLFQGHWAPGDYSYPFDLPVAAELPTYQGKLFTVTRMVSARAVPAQGASVAGLAIVWIACSPRDDAWFDPREVQLPPVAFVLNDAPIRLVRLKRAAEAAVGFVTGSRRPVLVELRPRVLCGGGSVTILVTAPAPARRLRGLRARLIGVEEWPRDKGPVRRTVHTSMSSPEITSTGNLITLRFVVMVPPAAISIDPTLQWRIRLVGAYGCLDHGDRWQPLWIGPSEASLRQLRDRTPQLVAADCAKAEQALRDATSLRGRMGAYARGTLAAAVALTILGVVAVNSPPGAALGIVAATVLPLVVIALIVRRGRTIQRIFRDGSYRARVAAPRTTTATEDPAVPPPQAPMIVDLIKVGEAPVAPHVTAPLRQTVIATQRRILRRGTLGLALLLAINLAASLIGPAETLPPGLAVVLTVVSVLVLLVSAATNPSGRPLSCFVGFAPLLAAVWIVVSAWRAIAAVTVGLQQGIAADLWAGIILAIGGAGVLALALGGRRHAAPGTRLLVLWVFGAASRMEEIMREAALLWIYLGPIQYLRGPGSRADLGRLAAAFTGGARSLFADSLPQVMAHLRRFRFSPNLFGIYSINSIQCSDAAWRDALDALVDTTDLVLMDLTSFGEKNQGCAYELGVLIDRVPASRFVLVVDGTTDIRLLTRLLGELWNAMPLTSPNRATDASPVRLLRIPMRDAATPGRPWYEVPMNDLVRLLFEPVAGATAP